MIYMLLAVLAGSSIVVSRMTNATLAEHIGVYPSTFYNYVTGLASSLVLLLFVRESVPVLTAPQSIGQAVVYIGGLMGLSSVVISNIVTHKLSAFVMTLLVFISQLFTGILLDYALSGFLSPGKLVGGILLLAGLILYQQPGKSG